jgi:hypothetical protein
MIMALKAIKKFVARNTNSQLHSLTLSLTPLSTLVTGWFTQECLKIKAKNTCFQLLKGPICINMIYFENIKAIFKSSLFKFMSIKPLARILRFLPREKEVIIKPLQKSLARFLPGKRGV